MRKIILGIIFLLSQILLSCSSADPQPIQTVVVTVLVSQPTSVFPTSSQPPEITPSTTPTKIPAPTPTNTLAPPPTGTTTSTPTPSPHLCSDSNAINWDEAKNVVGEETTIFGQVVDSHYASSTNGQPTFLNIGKPYPDLERFTVLFWVQNRDNFPSSPEDYYLEQYVCVTGVVELYEGVVEMEISEPSQIFIP